MPKIHFTLLVVCFGVAVCLFSGCGGNPRITGHVMFDDGTALTVGEVIFESETVQARGPLDSSGRFVMGSAGAHDGVPTGQYRVYISGALEPTGRVILIAGSPRPEMRPLIDAKHTQPEASGLTCDVKGSMKFDITVSKP